MARRETQLQRPVPDAYTAPCQEGRIRVNAGLSQFVVSIDLRGIGETYQTVGNHAKPYFGTDAQDVYTAYLLGRCYVGMRAEDILVCARWLSKHQTVGQDTIRLVTVGNVSVPALHAAALEPALFASVKLKRSLKSWSSIIEESGPTHNQLINFVQGALTVYDLDNLAATLTAKLTVEEPLDVQGRPAGK